MADFWTHNYVGEKLIENMKNADRIVKIGVVGKYVSYGDSEHKDVYISVLEAVKHATAHLKVKPIIEQIQSTKIENEGTDILKKYDGIIIPGGFGKKGTEGIIETIKFCRENNVPFLGLCYGMQMAVIEFARNVCGLEGANTTENESDIPYPVIDFMPEQKELIKLEQYGATMRLGAYPAVLKEGTKVRELYRKEFIFERHRHRYEVSPVYIDTFEKEGMIFSGYHVSVENEYLMEFVELKNHIYFIATQAHPEFKSRIEDPAPLFLGFAEKVVEYAKKD